MELASKLVETKNKLLFRKLVKSKWGLTDDGYKLFEQRLLFDRPIAKEYKKIIGDAPDLRKRFIVKDEKTIISLYKDRDYGYKIFKDAFPDFIKEHSISYINFSKNKFMRGKDEVRIFKGIKKHYSDIVDEFYDKDKKGFYPTDIETNLLANKLTFFIERSVRTLFYNGSSSYRDKICDIFEADRFVSQNSFGLDTEKTMFKEGVLEMAFGFGYGDKPTFVKIEDQKKANKIVSSIVDLVSELVGKYKMPSRSEIQLVVSLNPIDWLLCSTKESWSSCLSLESSYMYWMGLPSLIGDKNRVLFYLTDGTKKNFLGMETDKFLSRSWGTLIREKKTHRTLLAYTREYPNRIGLYALLKKFVDIPFFDENYDRDRKYVGRYYVESINFKSFNKPKKEFFMSIYLDHGSIHVARKNKGAYKAGEYLWYKFTQEGGGGVKTILIDPEENTAQNKGFYISDYWYENYIDEGENLIDVFVSDTNGRTLNEVIQVG